MAIERKKYWQVDGKWFCETSYYHEDIQAATTAFVREIDEADVPDEHKPAPTVPAELPAPSGDSNPPPASTTSTQVTSSATGTVTDPPKAETP